PMVRVTAQVIQAKDGFHVWSETYDRELTDIFAVQDEIARAVSGALKVSFGGAEGKSLVANTTENMAAYDLYLKAKDAHKFRRIPEAIEFARQVTDMEPDYAPGWAVYAQALALAPNWIYGDEPLESAGAFARAEMAAQMALILDPKSVEALGALANIKRTRHQWAEAEALYREALAIDADSPVILEDYSEFFLAVGKLREGKAMGERLARLEPQVPIYQNSLQAAYDSEGDLGQALALAERIYRLTPDTATFAFTYAQALANAGKLEEARAFARTNPVLTDYFRKFMELYIIARTPGAKTLDPEQAEFVRDEPFLMAAFGMKEPLFQWLAREVRLGWWGDFFNFSLDMKQFRGTPEFKAYVEQLKLPAYWRANGWADACRPKGNDDFECKP
ncbi:MAG TPA: hypothetical protein VD713_03620, partial [Sphingomonadales bacterium]|nr:hypothetical protein [Sphingomonadales bacterium]